MLNSSIWPIDRTLPDATTPDQSGSGSDGNEVVFRIRQSSSITEVSSLDSLVSYTGHSFDARLTPLQRCSRYILQPQPTDQNDSSFEPYERQRGNLSNNNCMCKTKVSQVPNYLSKIIHTFSLNVCGHLLNI